MDDAIYPQTNSKSIGEYLSIAKRRINVILISFFASFIVVAIVLYTWPPTYQSKAIILIEEQDVPRDLVPSTVTSYAVQRIEEIKQKIMTNANIIDIVERFELLEPNEIKRLTRSEIASNFRKNVFITPISAEVIDPRSGRPTEATIAFSVVFKGRKINTVHKVTNELVTLLLNENLKERAEQSESTSQFLRSEANALDKLLKEYEQSIAEFKEKHKDSLPELSAYNLNVVDRGHQEVLSIQTRIQDLENRKINLASQLTQLDKSAPTILPTGEAILGPSDRLKALQSEYAYKKSIYKKEHPELLRLAREIGSLTSTNDLHDRDAIAKELSEVDSTLISAQNLYSPDHPRVISLQRQKLELETLYESTLESYSEIELPADNPSYILVATQIEGIDSEISSLRNKMLLLESRITEHESHLLKSPVVEKEYNAMLRDYENARFKYREIKAKLMTADLAKNLEQERKGERFTLIQPPEIPEKPDSPNVKMLSFLGFIFCIGLGAGGGLLVDTFDKNVYGEKQIIQITQIEPLISIPYIKSDEDNRRTANKLNWLFVTCAVLLLMGVIAFHYLVKPLDVTWFIFLRKFGLM